MGSCWKCLLAWCFCIELRYIWECRPIEKVQMRAVRIFIGTKVGGEAALTGFFAV